MSKKLKDFERRGTKQCLVGVAEMETKHLHSCQCGEERQMARGTMCLCVNQELLG